jgi:hypothetical protein
MSHQHLVDPLDAPRRQSREGLVGRHQVQVFVEPDSEPVDGRNRSRGPSRRTVPGRNVRSEKRNTDVVYQGRQFRSSNWLGGGRSSLVYRMICAKNHGGQRGDVSHGDARWTLTFRSRALLPHPEDPGAYSRFL